MTERGSATIALIANFKVDDRHRHAFETVMGTLATATRANEPGVLLYQLCRSQDDARTYRLMEIYRDQAALDHHMQTDWLKAAGAELRTLLAERPVLERLDPIG